MRRIEYIGWSELVRELDSGCPLLSQLTKVELMSFKPVHGQFLNCQVSSMKGGGALKEFHSVIVSRLKELA